MKKVTELLLFLLFIFLLQAPIAHAEDGGGNTEFNPYTWTISDVVKMSNYMNYNQFVQNGKWITRLTIEKGSLKLRSSNVLSGESTIIGSDIPTYIISDGQWVTYIARKDSSDSTTVRRVRVTGGSEEILIRMDNLPISGRIYYLLEHNGYLYFAVNNEKNNPITGCFFRADMDGKNIIPILEKAIYYPYFIQDQLYYQDDNDGGKLHVCNPDGSNDRVFIDDLSFEYITDGFNFYYNSLHNGKHVLKIYTPESGVRVINNVSPRVIAFNGSDLIYSNSDDAGRLYTYDIETGKTEPLYLNDYVAYICFVDESHFFAYDADTTNMVENIILANVDGSDISNVN